MDSVSIAVRDLRITYQVFTETRLTARELVRSRLSGRTAAPVEAVRGVTLDVHEGESLAIVGRNGSGKSTLLRAMGGLLPPTEGHVYATTVPMLLGVSAALRPALTGRRNVEIGLLILGFRGEELAELSAKVIEFADIGTAIDRPLTTYSSGMRARLHFSIATSMMPKILMIDEALAVGDKYFKSKSYARIDQLREHAGTIVFVSHSAAEVRRVCETAVLMDGGEIVARGEVDEILHMYGDDER